MRRPGVLVLILLLAGPLTGPICGQEPSDRPPPPAPSGRTGPPLPLPASSWSSSDPRSQILLRLDCASRIDRHEVTLFGNGTVRLRKGPRGREVMHLGEVGPDELAATLDELRADNLSDVEPDPLTVEGDWVESCLLELDLPEAPAPDPAGERGRPSMESAPASPGEGSGGHSPLDRRFGRYSSLPLALSRVVQVADRLAQVAEKELPPGLPPGYEPARGDVLERTDGAHFQVVGFTSDGKGVELEGVDNPLTVYVASGDLARTFVGVVTRASRFGEGPP